MVWGREWTGNSKLRVDRDHCAAIKTVVTKPGTGHPGRFFFFYVELTGILFNSLNERISCNLTLRLNEKHQDLTCFLATAFDKNDVFVSSSVLGFFSGKSLELKHPLWRLSFQPFSPHAPPCIHPHTRTCTRKSTNPGVSWLSQMLSLTYVR